MSELDLNAIRKRLADYDTPCQHCDRDNEYAECTCFNCPTMDHLADDVRALLKKIERK